MLNLNFNDLEIWEEKVNSSLNHNKKKKRQGIVAILQVTIFLMEKKEHHHKYSWLHSSHTILMLLQASW